MVLIDWIILIGKVAKGAWDAFPGWLKLSIAGVFALSLWTWWAIDHGKGIQRAKDAAELSLCQGNVTTLKDALGRQNKAIDALKQEAARQEAESAKRAGDVLKRSKDARQKEAKRGFGPVFMNDFMKELIQ